MENEHKRWKRRQRSFVDLPPLYNEDAFLDWSSRMHECYDDLFNSDCSKNYDIPSLRNMFLTNLATSEERVKWHLSGKHIWQKHYSTFSENERGKIDTIILTVEPLLAGVGTSSADDPIMLNSQQIEQLAKDDGEFVDCNTRVFKAVGLFLRCKGYLTSKIVISMDRNVNEGDVDNAPLTRTLHVW